MGGSAGLVYEHVLGENKFIFVEQCANPLSVTILMKGPNKHTLTQVKDAVRDGLRAVKNALEDGCVVPGAGAYEVACHAVLKKFLETVKGKARGQCGHGLRHWRGVYTQGQGHLRQLQGKAPDGELVHSDRLQLTAG